MGFLISFRWLPQKDQLNVEALSSAGYPGLYSTVPGSRKGYLMMKKIVLFFFRKTRFAIDII